MTPDGQGRGAPTMSGFVDNYMRQPRGPDDSIPEPAEIMHCFSPVQVPVLSELARSFGVSDPLVRLLALPDLAEPLLRPLRDRWRLGQQRSAHFPYRMPSCSAA